MLATAAVAATPQTPVTKTEKPAAKKPMEQAPAAMHPTKGTKAHTSAVAKHHAAVKPGSKKMETAKPEAAKPEAVKPEAQKKEMKKAQPAK